MKKFQLLLSLLLISTLLSAQRTLTVLPAEVAVFQEQKVSAFGFKRNAMMNTMAGQNEGLAKRYETLVDAAIYEFISNQDQEIEYVRSTDEMPEEMQHDFFRFIKLIADGEMLRREKKKTGPTVSFGGKGMSNKEWREANEENLQPLATKFGEFFNSRYMMLIRFQGLHKPSKRDIPDIFGGAKYQIAIVDANSGEMVYYKSSEQGRKQETNNQSDSPKIVIYKKITPKLVTKRITFMLDAGLNKHRSLIKAMERGRN